MREYQPDLFLSQSHRPRCHRSNSGLLARCAVLFDKLCYASAVIPHGQCQPHVVSDGVERCRYGTGTCPTLMRLFTLLAFTRTMGLKYFHHLYFMKYTSKARDFIVDLRSFRGHWLHFYRPGTAQVIQSGDKYNGSPNGKDQTNCWLARATMRDPRKYLHRSRSLHLSVGSTSRSQSD